MPNLEVPPELFVLSMQTPGSRGQDGARRMLELKSEYYAAVSARVKEIRAEFWELVHSNERMHIDVEVLTEELSSIDADSVIPRPEMITTPAQCDDLIFKLNNNLARIGRIWVVASTAANLVGYELSLVEKWLRCRFTVEEAKIIDAKTGVMLAAEQRYVNQLEVLSKHAERVYKRIETQLPSLRDLSDRKYQESRFRHQGE